MFVKKNIDDIVTVNFTDKGYEIYKQEILKQIEEDKKNLRNNLCKDVSYNYPIPSNQQIRLSQLYMLFGEDILFNPEKYIINGEIKYEVNTLL